jgi:hypothetical protein
MQQDDQDPFRFRQNHPLVKLVALVLYCGRDVGVAFARPLLAWVSMVSLLVYSISP